MKATSVKQIKFNRGQVSDMLSERVDMGLQNACGTVYNNTYINRYGQVQSCPSLVLCSNKVIPNIGYVLHMFDTGTDKVYVIAMESGGVINVYGPLSKSDPYQQIDFTSVKATYTLETPGVATRAYQFGYNVVFYGDDKKPWLLTLTPLTLEWASLRLTVKEHFFDDSFNNVYVRGVNTGTPDSFTPPTSSFYKIADQTAITTSVVVTVDRNGAGGNFTQDLVGQVLQCHANAGALQVRSVESADSLTAYVLSPLVSTNANLTYIAIPFENNKSEWVFGYEKAFGSTYGYPDSVVYANQRLIFGGNDYRGNIICASRVGVINDFDPESATESDAFSVQIASKDFCRIIGFTVSNNELRIACTNGEYALPLSSLTPSGVLNGFDMRSEVGMAKRTAICDCGGLTAYVSNDGSSIYGTQFNLLKDRYQPISLSSQTSDMINNCKDLVYLTNRPNSEGNCLVGLNSDGTMFVSNIDLNSGLVGMAKMTNYPNHFLNPAQTYWVRPDRLHVVGSALWVEFYRRRVSAGSAFLARFTFGEIFDFPAWYNNTSQSVKIPSYMYMLIFEFPERARTYRALYYDSETSSYKFITPTGATDNGDGTHTLTFDDTITQSNIVCAGFVRQADWRSVEIGVGMATREINKQIVKLEGVIEPTQITGKGNFAGLVLTPNEAKNFITLTNSKEVQTMDVDNLSNTSYTENTDLVWRRAFDNPSRELHYGLSMVAPFLVKSLTATVQYDEVA